MFSEMIWAGTWKIWERVEAFWSWNIHLTRTGLTGFSCVILEIWLIQRSYSYKGNPGREIHLLYTELLTQKEITVSQVLFLNSWVDNCFLQAFFFF